MSDAGNEFHESPDVRTIKQLVRLMHRFDLTALDWTNDKTQLRLRRGGREQVQYAPAPAQAPPTPREHAAPPSGEAPAAPAKEGTYIRSPMVGTFYDAASPEAKPFVTIGGSVRSETTVCLIEAMKVFTEINAGLAGTVVEVLVKSGQPVEFDQPLFRIEPA